MIKVAFLDQGEFLGGAERFLMDFFKSLKNLEKRALNPVVLGAKNKKYQSFLVEQKIPRIEFDFPSVSGNFLKKGMSIFRLILAAKKLKKISETQKISVFFSNTPRAHLLLFFAKKFWGLPGHWICFFHDFTTRPPQLLKKIGNKADVLIANSIPTRTYLRQALDEKDFSKIKIVENGINFDEIPEAIPPLNISKILCLGRIDPRKGQKYVLEAAKILSEQGILPEVFIVGSAVESDKQTKKYQKEIWKLAEIDRLQKVQFSPEVENPFKAILSSDVVVFPSTEPETFGRVVIEALALGKLVLAFDQTGPKEILKNYGNFLRQKGIVLNADVLRIEKNSSAALARALAYFIKNPEKIPLFTQCAREFVEKNYPLSETKKRLIEIFLGK